MSKKILPLFLLIAINAGLTAQTSNDKIKVILLGTFHYGSTSDRNSTAFADLFTPERQQQLDSMATALTRFGVNKVFVEMPYSRQQKLDSLFALYRTGNLTDTTKTRDETIQIGFRTALLSGAGLVAADYRQELPYDQMDAYEAAHKDDTVASHPFFEIAYPFKVKQKKLPEMSLLPYYVQLNSAYNRQRIQYDYLHFSLAYGKDTSFVGTDFTAAWYQRNLKIFTNVLRNLDAGKDKTIVVLFGSSHTAILRQFFTNHPYFEVVELDQVFR
jgi:Family of unknown function (DUF5694)